MESIGRDNVKTRWAEPNKAKKDGDDDDGEEEEVRS